MGPAVSQSDEIDENKGVGVSFPRMHDCFLQ
ncbi:hypothetical protein H710_00411 [Bartonella bacilliformis Ver097]|uniref:Uncharacterized protein n=1 Tax=Bartonella bacilliformis Ver097 TaxID=1293911 RepID=A0A072R3W6_BARBA|nr:hypothetical protein H710_00411 [Bartonella bacilliformis Ver097]